MARRDLKQLSVVAAFVAMAIPCGFFTLVVVRKETKLDRICQRFSDAHPAIQSLVGEPVKVTSTVTEATQHNPKVGSYTRLALELSGPKGSAGLTVVLRRGSGQADRWKIDEASLRPAGGDPQPLDVSAVPMETLWDPELESK